ncbi:hypothetical protein CAC42_7368 [Sphaceloma murrayae]|uniref:Uncharacterized protein n=1 Tax=Sphaceloma murrayae TaxID=2082308 RepID=A0A2K1QWU4_9PEZI|nr:hypothetical protein CAC42_7368 [Sphaceloma murrayae]
MATARDLVEGHSNTDPNSLTVRDQQAPDSKDTADKMDHESMPMSSFLALLFPLPHILLTIYLVPLLPCQSLGFALSAYATFSLFASILGLLGLRRRSSTLLYIYSHHLLLDVFLSLVPQLTLLAVFHDVASQFDACPAPSIVYDAQKSYGKFQVPTSDMRTDRFLSTASVDNRFWCMYGLQAAQGFAILIIIFGGFAQWKAAMSIRRLAVCYDVCETGTSLSSDDILDHLSKRPTSIHLLETAQTLS